VHQVYQVAKVHGIPIIGQGGINSAEDAVEFLLAGATTIGIGTALFYDPMICKQVNSGLVDYLVQNGLDSVSELTGAVQLPEQVNRCDCD
jgi:dihydroorotate dehydrogenase (NAD+) catalytic subunit